MRVYLWLMVYFTVSAGISSWFWNEARLGLRTYVQDPGSPFAPMIYTVDPSAGEAGLLVSGALAVAFWLAAIASLIALCWKR